MNLMTQSVSKTVRVDEMFDDYLNEKQPLHLRAINETRDYRKNEKKADIQFKVELAKIHVKLNKLLLINKLNLCVGPQYVIILLEIISLNKNLFALKLEEGIEIEIPRGIVLEGGELPLSYQYYDWVYPIVKLHFNDAVKQKIAKQNRAKMIYKESFLDKLKQSYDNIK